MNFNTSQYVFIRSSGPTSELVPGRVLWSHDSLIAAEIDSAAVFQEGTPKQLTLYYEDEARKFVQRPTHVEGMLDREAAEALTEEDAAILDLADEAQRAVVVFELLGEPVSAENRQCYRVRATSFGIKATFATDDNCDLTDISQTGFAIVSDEHIKAGSIVNVALPRTDPLVQGLVRIQSVRRLRNGRYRYGLVCVGKETQRACAKYSTEIQRQQLLRLAGRT